jgi:hypothetical protein
MNRARVIVKEISIQKKGEVHFFQIKFPKNVTRIRGIEFDAFMISPIETGAGSSDPALPPGVISEPNRTPFLKWTPIGNPILGKLKLQSLNRNNIFYETWIPFIFYNGGIPDMSFGMFPKSPYSLNTYSKPKSINLECTNAMVNGMFIDRIGKRQNADLNYRIKVFVWIETTEDAKGVKYDFQEESRRDELQIKM